MMLDDYGHQGRVHTAALWSGGDALMVVVTLVIFQLDKVSLNPMLASIYLPELDAESRYGAYLLHDESSLSSHMNTDLNGSP